MFTSWSEQSTPAELSSASVLIRPPARSNSIRPRSVTPRLPPSPDHLGAHLVSVDTDRVVRLVADLPVRFGRRLDVGADPAVPQQVDRREQDRPDQIRWRELGDTLVDAERGRHLRADRDGLAVTRPHAATRADQVSVVVGPR